MRLLLAVIFIAAGIFIDPAVKAGDLPQTYGSAAVSDFYKAINNRLFWFGDSTGKSLRQQLLWQLEHCASLGLNPGDYSVTLLKNHFDLPNATAEAVTAADHLYTTAALSYLQDVLKGNHQNGITGSDALAVREDDMDRKCVQSFLAACGNGLSLDSAVYRLEPATEEYRALKKALAAALETDRPDTAGLLKIALNSYRRIHHLHYPKYVVVNIASGWLRYYERDSLLLEMKVVTGKPSTPTPRFTAYCNEIILYPYWNVPRSIAVNEILPFCKSNPAVLSLMNMQVLDEKGRVVDAGKINWKLYDKNNFPYRFRQSTGCDNALGVMKFNLDSPYGVYLHDTNMKSAFAARKRYFSHGCIRLEKPLALADFLLAEKLDSSFLNACLKEEQPHALKLPSPVPVFVVYVRARVDTSERVIFYEDIYGLR